MYILTMNSIFLLYVLYYYHMCYLFTICVILLPYVYIFTVCAILLLCALYYYCMCYIFTVCTILLPYVLFEL